MSSKPHDTILSSSYFLILPLLTPSLAATGPSWPAGSKLRHFLSFPVKFSHMVHYIIGPQLEKRMYAGIRR